MLTAAWTNLCNAKADFGSDADTLSIDVSPNIEPGCGGGRSRTIVTASRAVCFPSGPAPTRHVWNGIVNKYLKDLINKSKWQRQQTLNIKTARRNWKSNIITEKALL